MPRVNASTAGKDAAALRRKQALDFRIQGASFRKIGEQLGISHTQAEKDVAAELAVVAAANTASAEVLRELELARLDVALRAIVGPVQQGHLGAIDRWVRLSEARRRLLGLDAPARQDITSNGETIKLYGVDPDGV